MNCTEKIDLKGVVVPLTDQKEIKKLIVRTGVEIAIQSDNILLTGVESQVYQAKSIVYDYMTKNLSGKSSISFPSSWTPQIPNLDIVDVNAITFPNIQLFRFNQIAKNGWILRIK